MKYRLILIISFLFILSIALMHAADQNITLYSTKSGYISSYDLDSSFSSINADSSGLIYYKNTGLPSLSAAVHYEWFNLSSIPKNSIIKSAYLYKYNTKTSIGGDYNRLMSPYYLASTNRVTLGKLSESFLESDSYSSIGRFKQQTILNKVDKVSKSPEDYVLEYNVTDIINQWANGEVNHGFSFLGNYNTMGTFGATYYFRNAADSYKPKLVIVYSINDSVICSSDPKCGTNGFIGNKFCNQNSVLQNYITFTCNNPGKTDSYCSNSTSVSLIQTCSVNQQCLNSSCVDNLPEQKSCIYAKSAYATSENIGAEAIYATGAPDSPSSGECANWGGNGYNWNPVNWNIKANLTLKYNSLVNVTNFTIIGDYYMCWDRAWLKNSITNQTLQVLNSPNNSCVLFQKIPGFYADIIILETCGWQWTSTDAVELCGNINLVINNTPVCGNSKIETGEECDDGNKNNNDSCSNLCRFNICGDGYRNPLTEECDDKNLLNNDGCSNLCKNENISDDTIYVISYIGDIDGEVDEAWYNFYKKIADFYVSNNITGAFSFYPGTMSSNNVFSTSFKKLYFSENIELIQKGYIGDDLEMEMDSLSYDEQKLIIQSGINAYNQRMKLMGIKHPKKIITYDQINGRVNNITAGILKELGYKNYFDVFLDSGISPLVSTSDFDSIQYGVSFTRDSGVGSQTIFYSPDQIIKQVKEFNITNPKMIYVNGHKVVPVWVHHEDFEDDYVNNMIDIDKWSSYVDTIQKLKKDPKIIFVTPGQVYYLRYPSQLPVCGNSKIETGEECDDGNKNNNDSCSNLCRFNICGDGYRNPLTEECDDKNLLNNDGCSNLCKNEILKKSCIYAKSAYATSENIGAEAIYATGAPDSPSSGECANWGGNGYNWNPVNWNIKANLTLKYNSLVNVTNFTIIGDYYMCWDRAWLKNSITNQTLQVLNSPNNSCVLFQKIPGFYADIIILETCGWQWTSTDAVELCGNINNNTQNTNLNNNISICNWKNCYKGAVSLSADDYYTSCSQALEENGYRGTYFLSNTNTYTTSQWTNFNTIFKKGHEIGTHTQSHICSLTNDASYKNDIQKNINDILLRTSVTQKDLITHAHSCGFVTKNFTNILSSNWNFLSARGYYFNQPEYFDPINFFNLKSYNSHDYPGDSFEPPNYYDEADKAELSGNWANLVFHNECSDDGVISYLKEKNLWVDTIGNVVKYTKLRQNANIYDVQDSQTKLLFKIKTNYTNSYYNQNLTIKVDMKSKPLSVKFNNKTLEFIWVNNTEEHYTKFNLPFPINGYIEISK